MNADRFGLLLGILLALGVGLVIHAVLEFLIGLTRVRRRSRLLALAEPDVQRERNPSADEVLGLEKIPWVGLYLFGGAVGLVLFVTLGPLVPAARLAAVFLPAGVWFSHGYLVRKRRRALAGQVRQFLVDLRMLLTLRGSLLLALQDLARTAGGNTPVLRRLERAFQGSRPRSGMEILDRLARELKSPHLEQAVQRIHAAQGGTLNVDHALATAIQEIGDELNVQIEEQMQQLPTRMTFLAIPFLLGPIIVMLLYPLADGVLKTLSGAYASGGGF